MKRFLIVFSSLVILLATASCTDLLDPSLRDAMQVISEDATMTIGFGVPAEVSTKASMASDPSIESIHVFVFDEEGTLLQVRKATIGETSVSQNYDNPVNAATMTSSWHVDNIMMSAEKRVLHFVANLADDQIPTSGSEESIFRSLAVVSPNAAYWQRIELASILPYKYKGGGKYSYVDDDGVFQEDQPVKKKDGTSVAPDGSYTDLNGYTVNVGDYIDSKSRKIVNGTGYYADEVVSAKVALVPLVRNFARIEFTNSWNTFKLKKIALAYEPAAGLVAPYNGGFASEYIGLTPGAEPDMTATTYTPLLPAAGVNKVCPTSFIPAENNRATLFIYERAIPTTNATCVIIGGELAGATPEQKDSEGNTWFKIELADTQGKYFKIYRDCTYQMNVTSIDATAIKYSSPEAAFKAAPVGDLSNSPETATLTQITDGNGLTLWVNYIDHVDLTGGTTVPLLYTFFHQNGSNRTYFPAKVEFEREKIQGSNLDWATTATVTKYTTPLSESSPYYSQIPDRNYNWYLAEVTLNPKDPNGAVLQSNIHVKGSVTTADGVPRNRTLSRNVTYTVMPQRELGLEASSLAADAADVPTVVTITLPNTLGPSVFPLTLKIEAQDNNLTPTDNMAVESGPSAFAPNSNTYYFLKTISYTEYLASANGSPAYSFRCAFKTTKSTGKTPVTKIRVTEKLKEDETRESLFLGGDDATVDLRVGPAFILSSDGVSVEASETNATFTVYSTGSENTQWTLTANNGATLSYGTQSGTSITGTGSQDITVTFPPNANTSGPATYTVTANRTGFQNQIFTVTQRPKPLLYTFNASDFTFGTGADTYNGSAASSDEYVSIALQQAAGTDSYLTLGRRTQQQTNRGSIAVTPKSGYKITEIKVTYSSATYAGYDFNGTTSVSVNTGTYNRDSSNSTTATWTGTSTDVIFTNGFTTSGWLTTTYNFPRVTSIEVTLEVI
jgi:hypothetical protein